MLELLGVIEAMESMLEYLGSWDFWFYTLWLSTAVGFGLCMGVRFFFILDSILDSLSKLRFKKDKQ